MSDAGLPQPWKEEEDSWERAVNNFKSDLKYWSYRIPPGYNKQYKFPVSSLWERLFLWITDIAFVA
jgi:hypothetical protein